MYKWVVERFMAGKLEPVVNEVGIAQGIFEVAYTDQVPESVRELVEQAAAAIANGELLKFLSQFPEPLD